MSSLEAMRAVLDLSRWAPSGDNTQPWRFEIIGPHEVVVHGHDTRDHCVYDLQGEASQVSLGALLETMSIAASTQGWTMGATRRVGMPEHQPTFDIHFTPGSIEPSPLAGSITVRSVQRRPMGTQRLTPQQKAELVQSVGEQFNVEWLEDLGARWRTAWLMFHNAKLRLTMPEAYEVHRSIIEWNASQSIDRVPDRALGVDAMTLKMMRFAMASWERVQFFNRFLAGSLAPRLQMDFLPSLACGAHLIIKARKAPDGIDDFVAAGRAVQRFWLTATKLGLWQQPEMTPLIFSRYARLGVRFSEQASSIELARQLSSKVTELVGPAAETAVWMGRIGNGSAPESRSIRRPIDSLMFSTPNSD
jgi:hypothetical protein